MSNEVAIWKFLKGKGFTDIAAAGIIGNLYAESGLIPNNLQNNYEASLGMNDFQYTQAVDNGTYQNFIRDAAGYGLAQWTFWTRKDGLLKLAHQRNRSVGDLDVQLDFLWSELQEFGLVSKLNACGSVRDASNLMLFEFEKPQDMGMSVQDARASWSLAFYDRFHEFSNVSIAMETESNSTKPKDETYSIIAFGTFEDLATAKAQLSNLQGCGFKGIIVPQVI